MNNSHLVYLNEEESNFPLQFCKDALCNISWGYMIWLLLALVISYTIYMMWGNSEPLSSIGPSLCFYYIVIIIHILFRLRKVGKANILAPDFIFLLLYTMFHLGYVNLYTFKILPYTTDVFYDYYSIPKAMLIINLGLLGFLFGYEVMSPKRKVLINQSQVIKPKVSWCVLGIALMIIALVMHLTALGTLGLEFFKLRGGYGAIQDAGKYTTSALALLLSYSINIMVFGLVIYIISSSLRYRKLFNSKLAFGLTIIFFILVILEGDRGPILKFGLPILLVRHYFIKSIRAHFLTILFVTSIFMFSVLGAIRTVIFDPKGMLQMYKHQKNKGELDWTKAFYEMGGSFLVVNITCQAVPESEPYWNGASWTSAAIHVVPFLQKVAFEKGLLRWSPSEWVTTTFFGPKAASRGFTVAAEGYLNFGLPGAFLELMLLGLFMKWLIVRFSKNPSAMWGIIMLVCIGSVIAVIRATINLATHTSFQIFVIAVLLKIFMGNEPKCELKTSEMQTTIVNTIT